MFKSQMSGELRQDGENSNETEFNLPFILCVLSTSKNIFPLPFLVEGEQRRHALFLSFYVFVFVFYG